MVWMGLVIKELKSDHDSMVWMGLVIKELKSDHDSMVWMRLMINELKFDHDSIVWMGLVIKKSNLFINEKKTSHYSVKTFRYREMPKDSGKTPKIGKNSLI